MSGKTGTQTAEGGGSEGADTKTGTPPSTPATSTKFETFDAFYDTQPEEVRTLIDGHVSGLKNAHERTKEERNELRTQIAEFKKAGSPEELKAQAEAAEKRSRELERSTRFYESDLAKKLSNPKLALGIARQENLINDDGTLRDAAKFEAEYPELFAKAKTPANAHRPGEGTQTDTRAPAQSMDDLIRQAAGRQIAST